jgi:hypothetical protein
VPAPYLAKRNNVRALTTTVTVVGSTTVDIDPAFFPRFPTTFPFRATFQNLAADPFAINSEIVTVTGSPSANTFTITRGVEGTFVQEWPVGTSFAMYITAGHFQEIEADLTAYSSISWVVGQIPSGSINGTNTVFTTTNPYIGGSLLVFRNGLYLQPGVGNDFVETNPSLGTFTMAVAPLAGANITVAYQRSISGTFNSDTVDGFHASATPTANQILVLNASAQFPDTLIGSSAYSTWTPSFTSTGGSLGNGTASGRFKRLGSRVSGWGSITLGTTTSFGTGTISWALPVTTSASESNRVIGQVFYNDNGVNEYAGILRRSTTTSAFAGIVNASGVITYTSSTSPFTFGNGDSIIYTFDYEAA